MTKVVGTVGFAGTAKFDKNKFAIKLDEHDEWFNQKMEYVKFEIPSKGSKVELTVKGKYVQDIKVLEGGSSPANNFTGKAPAKASGGGFNALGVELGHAANNAVHLCIAQGVYDIEAIKSETKKFYEMMRDLRGEYEGGEVVKEAPKKAAPVKKAPKVEPEESFEDDDFPF